MKIFYGWKMVAAAVGMQFLSSLFLFQSLGAYASVLIEEKGWSKTAVSGAVSMQSMEGVFLGPIMGGFLDRYGSKQILRLGVIILGIGFMLLSQIESINSFYGAVLTLAVGTSLCGYFPLNVGIIQWFEKKRARALSTVGIGLALGGICVPAVAWSMQTFGWRATAFTSGIVIILLGFPLASVFRKRPEDFGEYVDGIAPSAAPIDTTPDLAKAASKAEPSFTTMQALRTRSFWLLAAGHAFALLIVTAVNAHAINHMRTALHYTIAQASLIITIMTFFQLAGVLIGGYLGDKYQKRLLSAMCMIMHAIGLLFLTFATGRAALITFAVLHGLAWGIRGPFMQALRADYFGRQSIGQILGISGIIAAIGQFAGPLVAGVLGDATGNYRLGFTVLALTAATGSLLFLMAKKPTLASIAHKTTS